MVPKAISCYALLLSTRWTFLFFPQLIFLFSLLHNFLYLWTWANRRAGFKEATNPWGSAFLLPISISQLFLICSLHSHSYFTFHTVLPQGHALTQPLLARIYGLTLLTSLENKKAITYSNKNTVLFPSHTRVLLKHHIVPELIRIICEIQS